MRIYFLFILQLLFVLHVTAQIKTDVSYNKETKELTLTFTNHLNENIYLSPKVPDDPFAKDLCWFERWWKDQDSIVVSHCYPDPIYGYRRCCYIASKGKRAFKFNMKNNKPTVKYIEIFFHLEIHTRGKNNFHWKEEFTKVFEY